MTGEVPVATLALETGRASDAAGELAIASWRDTQ